MACQFINQHDKLWGFKKLFLCWFYPKIYFFNTTNSNCIFRVPRLKREFMEINCTVKMFQRYRCITHIWTQITFFSNLTKFHHSTISHRNKLMHFWKISIMLTCNNSITYCGIYLSIFRNISILIFFLETPLLVQ